MTNWSAYYARAFEVAPPEVDLDAADARLWRSLEASPWIEARGAGRGGTRLSIRFGRRSDGGDGRAESLGALRGILGRPDHPAVHPDPAVRTDAEAMRALRDGANRILLSHGGDALSIELWPSGARAPKALMAPRDAVDRWARTGIAIGDFARNRLGSVPEVRDRWTVEAWSAAVAGSRTMDGLRDYAATEVARRDASAIHVATMLARASEAAGVVLGEAVRCLEDGGGATRPDAAKLRRVRDAVRLWRPRDGADAAVAAFREVAEVCAGTAPAVVGRGRDLLEQGEAIGGTVVGRLLAG